VGGGEGVHGKQENVHKNANVQNGKGAGNHNERASEKKRLKHI